MKSFQVEVGDVGIDNYEQILSKFSNWKKYKREINLNLLFEEDKKIQFEVEITNSQSVLYVSVSEDDSLTSSLTNVSSTINKLTFIILNSKVLKLEVELNHLDTKWGKIIKSIIASGVELKLNQHINIENQVDNFYLDLPKQAA